MVEPDYDTFDRAFRRVSGIYRLKLSEDDLDTLTRTYFRLLAHAPLADVLAAGKTCASTCKAFPKPVDWLHALPTRPVAALSADVRVLPTPERLEYVRAESLMYEDFACACPACIDAGVADRPMRFVPDEVDGVLDRAIDTDRNRVVVAGHWAHGEELARWYIARAAFYASAPRSHTPLGRALLVLVSREPGEDG